MLKTELDSAWESAIHNAERARKAEADIERLQAELAEAKKFKDGMLDVLGGACPNDHRSTPFEEFKGCTPCLRAELAEAQTVKESLIVALDLFGRHSPKGKPCPVCEAIDAAMAGGE